MQPAFGDGEYIRNSAHKEDAEIHRLLLDALRNIKKARSLLYVRGREAAR